MEWKTVVHRQFMTVQAIYLKKKTYLKLFKVPKSGKILFLVSKLYTLTWVNYIKNMEDFFQSFWQYTFKNFI